MKKVFRVWIGHLTETNRTIASTETLILADNREAVAAELKTDRWNQGPFTNRNPQNTTPYEWCIEEIKFDENGIEIIE